jgi:hypothetical protein
MKEMDSQIWGEAVNILKKQLWTTDKGWSSNLGVGQGTNNSSLQKTNLLQNVTHWVSDLGRLFGMTNKMENGHEIWNSECQESL